MSRPIGEWFQALRDAGVTAATLLGKGPSLDLYSPIDGAYVMGVNDVPTCQRCDAVTWVDSVFINYEYPGVDVIRRGDRRDTHEGRGYYWIKWRPDAPDDPAAIPRDIVRPTHARLYEAGAGIGTYALALLALADIERVTLWGFDGGIPALGEKGYAKCLAGKSPVSHPGKNSVLYAQHMIEVCEQPWSNIKLLQHGTADGMMTLWAKPCQSPNTSSTCAA